jgi:hypothetical protein
VALLLTSQVRWLPPSLCAADLPNADGLTSGGAFAHKAEPILEQSASWIVAFGHVPAPPQRRLLQLLNLKNGKPSSRAPRDVRPVSAKPVCHDLKRFRKIESSGVV